MQPDRRDFIKKALTGVLALLGIGFIVPALRILTPSRVREKEMAYFPLLPEEELPRAGVKKAELTYKALGRDMKARVFLVSSPEGVTALSSTCTHLGCLVNYRRDKKEFVCPCHSGRYDLTGKNIGGPPPAPLTRFPVRIRDGIVHIGMKV
ncbi:MAG TPA: hypothetical protein DCO77_11255 [Nitrospiraceae bacterium]|nr:hypothetical protein [Nitrospiraceae bacterium]